MSEDKSLNTQDKEPEKHRLKRLIPPVYIWVIIILVLMPVFYRSYYKLHILILTFIYVIASMSLRTITISGQFPLAHGAFMGLGAYFAGMTSKWLGWPGCVTIPSAALFAGLIGILIGYPFSRLRALYYAMGSLFFGIGIIYIIYAIGQPTGGYAGLVGIPPLFIGSKVPYYYFFLGLMIVSALALYRFEFSRIGTTLKAVAQSYLVASSVGINEGFYRVLAVGVGCFFAGLAGAGYAHYNSTISGTSFDFFATLWLVIYVLIGGMKSFAGPIMGTFILFLVPELFRDLKIYTPFISAALLATVVYLMPQGLISIPIMLKSWFHGRSSSDREE